MSVIALITTLSCARLSLRKREVLLPAWLSECRATNQALPGTRLVSEMSDNSAVSFVASLVLIL